MRTGLIAKKVGMSRVFDQDGLNIPVTLLQLDNCRVLEKKTFKKNGYNALLISYGKKKKNRINKCVKGFFTKIKEEPSIKQKEFRVSEEGMLDVGSEITTDHFIVGQKVDVRGETIGKGFAGGMKRHNFGGNRASHGVSISHRSHGSTGQCQDPGKVFKGKKMAGRLGGVYRTIQNLEVIKTLKNENLIIVKGSVPGPKGLFVTIFDSVKFKNSVELPYPTNKQVTVSNNLSDSKNIKDTDVIENKTELISKEDNKTTLEKTEPGNDKKDQLKDVQNIQLEEQKDDEK